MSSTRLLGVKILREQIVMKARECVGTQWKHLGRTPGIGIDCIGVIVHAGHSLRLFSRDVKSYPRDPIDDRLVREIEDTGFTEVDSPGNGDLILFRIGKYPRHVGIYCADQGTVIHSFDPKTIETTFGPPWSFRVFKYYTWPLLH